MNLLDKHKQKGLAMLPAFFLLFSCEEPSELGLNINPDEGAVVTHYAEFPVETSQIRIDTVLSSSVISINPTAQQRTGSSVLIGKAYNSAFGELTATAYTNIGPPDSIPVLPENADADSVFLRLNYSSGFIGEDISASQTLKVLRTKNPIAPTTPATTSRGAQYRYFITDSEPLEEAVQIGEITFDTSQVQKSTLNIRLSNEFGNEILNQMREDKTVFSSQEGINNFFGSLAIVPGENNTFINNYNLVSGSQIQLYYGDKDTKPVSFFFGPRLPEGVLFTSGDLFPTYYSLEADFSGTAFENAPEGNNVEFETPDNKIYFRAGTGILTKLEFPELEELATSYPAGSLVVNQAVLEIDSVLNDSPSLPIPSGVAFYFTEEENNARATGVNGVELLAASYIKNEQDTVYRYRTDIAPLIQTYVESGGSATEYLQGILYPSSSPTSLLSIIAEPKYITLKVYYTTLEKEN